MEISRNEVLGLLDGTLSEKEKTAIRARADEGAASFRAVMCYQDRGGASLMTVILDSEQDLETLPRRLASVDPDRFTFHRYQDEFVEAVEAEHEVARFPLDLRGIPMVSDEDFIRHHNGDPAVLSELAGP